MDNYLIKKYMSQHQTNSAQFKQILSTIRNNDYAHAGESEAIALVFKKITKNPKQILLDVGCGLGGTANYLTEKGWGKVIGFDIDPETIEYAKTYYPNIEFHLGNVANISQIIATKVDIVYAFNIFYAIDDQIQALTELRKLAKKTTKLAIFDYSDNIDPKIGDAVCGGIDSSKIDNQLAQAGWQIENKINLNKEYELWYDEFLKQLTAKKSRIISLSNQETYDYAYDKYYKILYKLKNGLLGGILIYAETQ
jgi:phosphoethanolamine N-methyltransferase